MRLQKSIFLLAIFVSCNAICQSECISMPRSAEELKNSSPKLENNFGFEYEYKFQKDQKTINEAIIKLLEKKSVVYISWNDAEKLVRLGFIRLVQRIHNQVKLISDSGRVYIFEEVKPQNIFAVIREVDPCSNWIISMED